MDESPKARTESLTFKFFYGSSFFLREGFELLVKDLLGKVSLSRSFRITAGMRAIALCAVVALAGHVGFAQAQPQATLGVISGTVVDISGAVIGGANVTLTQPSAATGTTSTESSSKITKSDSEGHFTFSDVPPGPFQISASAPGFSAAQKSDTLQPGEHRNLFSLTLPVAPADVAVDVRLAPEQVAEDEVRAEEKQRLFGVIPNYYMTFDPHAAPLTTKLKFQLAWKTTIDPVSFGLVGAIAAFQQAADSFGGYGQGAAGYARRYGAAYGDFVSGTFIGGAILPSLFKQDPRYFYKGTGGTRARLLYAIANSVIRKSDKGHWQPDYSGILGSLAAGGISNLYYPDADRSDARVTFENLAVGIGFGAAGNIIQEFFFKKFTSHIPDPNIDKQP